MTLTLKFSMFLLMLIRLGCTYSNDNTNLQISQARLRKKRGEDKVDVTPGEGKEKAKESSGDNMTDENDSASDCDISEAEDDDDSDEPEDSIEEVFCNTNEQDTSNEKIFQWLNLYGEPNLLASHQVVLFVGDPGCGKTTLSYMLCYASDGNLQVRKTCISHISHLLTIIYRFSMQITYSMLCHPIFFLLGRIQFKLKT